MVAKIKDINLYYVGGVVRDELLGISSFDTDFCYEGDAIKFAQSFNIIKENPKFGTVRILFDNEEVDIASTRNESYPKPGHLPIINDIGCNLKEDLKRRDFTINALAKNTITGEIVDYFNGIEDLKNRKIRILHEKSFIDDPSRIIRALKFSVRFGFELEDYTKKLQEDYLNNINYDQSYHRLKKELKETFNLNNEKAFETFIQQGIYKLLGKKQNIPKLKTSINNLITEFNIQNCWIIYMGLFDLTNFELTAEETQIINCYQNIKNFKPNSDFEIYKLFKNIPIESIILYAISVDLNIALKYLKELSNIEVNINGEHLKKLGIPQGKVYKEIFDYILKLKIKNPNLTLNDEINIVRGEFL